MIVGADKSQVWVQVETFSQGCEARSMYVHNGKGTTGS